MGRQNKQTTQMYYFISSDTLYNMINKYTILGVYLHFTFRLHIGNIILHLKFLIYFILNKINIIHYHKVYTISFNINSIYY